MSHTILASLCLNIIFSFLLYLMLGTRHSYILYLGLILRWQEWLIDIFEPASW